MPAENELNRKPPLNRLSFFAVLGASWLVVLAASLPSLAQPLVPARPQLVPSVARDIDPESLPVPTTPSAVLDLVEVVPFKLDLSYRNSWLAARPLVNVGLLVVLKVDPSYVAPRNAAEPVLYAGKETVQRLNQGDRSGFVIGIIPGEVEALTSAPIWFGQPELPERVTIEIVAAERARAEGAGITAFGAEKIASVLREAVSESDLAALLQRRAADLVKKYSPDEIALAETWLLSSAGSDVRR